MVIPVLEQLVSTVFDDDIDDRVDQLKLNENTNELFTRAIRNFLIMIAVLLALILVILLLSTYQIYPFR